MKYKVLSSIVAFCLASWFVLVFVIFNDRSTQDHDVQVSFPHQFVIILYSTLKIHFSFVFV